MKFNYNYLTNTLKRIKEEYTYEVCEDKRFSTSSGIYEFKGFELGEKEWIVLTFSHYELKIIYQKGNSSYQKTLSLPIFGEINFEFSQSDQITNNCQECQKPIKLNQPDEKGRQVLEIHGKWTGKNHKWICQNCMEKD
ncbi:MAG: hypothetical protein mread185_000039 [Mycoplasmataceae bacterium]|nr:MAG: hypothetical protein mread185_000039 [Mycoplasmataceae bacterium]